MKTIIFCILMIMPLSASAQNDTLVAIHLKKGWQTYTPNEYVSDYFGIVKKTQKLEPIIQIGIKSVIVSGIKYSMDYCRKTKLDKTIVFILSDSVGNIAELNMRIYNTNECDIKFYDGKNDWGAMLYSGSLKF